MRNRIGVLRTLARGRPGSGPGTGAANDNLRGRRRVTGRAGSTGAS